MTTKPQPIREGDLVRYTDNDGVEHEAIATSPVEFGEVWVRFTTRGREQPLPSKRVTRVQGPW